MIQETHADSFAPFYLSDELLNALERIEYRQPTPVQSSSIPLVMAGIDLIVQAQTGTGKTAAFGIPIVDMLEAGGTAAEVLVLAPTRELAKQVSEEFERLSHFKELSTTSIYGGAAYGPQIEALETAQIICATPGRLLDLLKQGKADLSNLRFLVLDEADEMLSMGFEKELNAILDFLPESRQSLLFSATVTAEIKLLAKSMLFYPEYISLSSDSVINRDVTHIHVHVDGMGRTRDLVRLLEREQPESAIIFANTKADTFMVVDYLKRRGYQAEVLNGDLPQSEREKTLKALRQGRINLLVATDVAARGIDISDLSHVFNYTLPDSPEVYVHRTGRTGRAGKKGRALSLVSPAEMSNLLQIKKHVDVDIIENTVPTTEEIIRAKQRHALDALSTAVTELDTVAYGGKLSLAEKFLQDAELDEANIRFLAKVLTLADLAMKGAAVAPAAPPAEAPAQDEAPEQEEEAEVRVTQEIVLEDEVVEEEEDAPVEKEEEAKPSRRDDRRSRRRDDRREERSEERREERDDSEEAPRRGRRRERRPREDRREERRDDRRSDRRESDSGRGRRSRSESARTEAPRPQHFMVRMYVGLGKNAFETPEALRETIVYMSGMDDTDYGEITLERSHSFVEVRKDYLYDVIEALDEQEWEGHTFRAKPARK